MTCERNCHFSSLRENANDFQFTDTQGRLSWDVCHLLQEASDVFLAALGPRQGGGIVLELAGHDVRVSAHRLTVIFLPIVLDAKAAGRHKAQEHQGDRCETGRKLEFLQDENNPQRATSGQKASDYKVGLWSWRGIANSQLKSTGNIVGMTLIQIYNPGSRVANSKTSVWEKAKSFHVGTAFLWVQSQEGKSCFQLPFSCYRTTAQKKKTFLLPFHHNLRESMKGEA